MTVKTPAAPPLPAELETLLRRLRLPYGLGSASTARWGDPMATSGEKTCPPVGRTDDRQWGEPMAVDTPDLLGAIEAPLRPNMADFQVVAYLGAETGGPKFVRNLRHSTGVLARRGARVAKPFAMFSRRVVRRHAASLLAPATCVI